MELIMLCLGRRVGQKIRIGKNITLMVLDVRGDTIRIGIDAPTDFPVHREEVAVMIEESGGELPVLIREQAE
jgi:carbon storage regulator